MILENTCFAIYIETVSFYTPVIIITNSNNTTYALTYYNGRLMVTQAPPFSTVLSEQDNPKTISIFCLVMMAG